MTSPQADTPATGNAVVQAAVSDPRCSALGARTGQRPFRQSRMTFARVAWEGDV